jgi:hypothetical protein
MIVKNIIRLFKSSKSQPIAKIFVSHPWSEDNTYTEFISLLNSQLEEKFWENKSIPRHEAIDITRERESDNQLEEIENEIIHLKAKIMNSNLPDVISRTVYDAHGNRTEVETKYSLVKELRSLRQKKEYILHDLQKDSEWSDPNREFALSTKGVAREFDLNPRLANAIRQRIVESNLLFVLISQTLQFRKWSNFEIGLANDNNIFLVGILVDDSKTRELDFICDKLISFDCQQVREIIESRYGISILT